MRKLALLLLVCGLASAETKKILVVGMEDAIPALQSVSPNVIVVAGERSKLVEQIVDADAIFGTISPELFRAAKKLKWVQTYSAGVETFRFPEFTNSNVVLTNCKIIQGPEIADHALAMLLSLTRQLNQLIPERTSEQWQKGKYHPVELRGKTAVVIGVGGIGSQIAQRASAFGMTVIGVDPKDIPFSPYISKVVTPNRLDDVLPNADVVFVSAPHTPESEGMMGSKQFNEMKKGSYFIAVSRGKLYSSEALVKALDEQRLAGAGLDVTNPEPLPKGHALWKFPNVVITPHIAGESDGIQVRRVELMKENIARFEKGETLLNVVDKVKGY